MDELSTVSFCRAMRTRMPKAEAVLWISLRSSQMGGLRFRRQHPIGPFVADFACVKRRFVIEVDGATHFSEEARRYDERRTRYLKSQGWRELRVSNEDVLTNLHCVLQLIWYEVNLER